jgi:hypothetical protein
VTERRASPEEIDSRMIISQPDALVSMENVFAKDDLEAKAYALTGIRKLLGSTNFMRLLQNPTMRWLRSRAVGSGAV